MNFICVECGNKFADRHLWEKHMVVEHDHGAASDSDAEDEEVARRERAEAGPSSMPSARSNDAAHAQQGTRGNSGRAPKMLLHQPAGNGGRGQRGSQRQQVGGQAGWASQRQRA